MKLYGKVKTLKQIQYDVVEKFGKITKEKINSSYFDNYYSFFNKEGYLIEENFYNSDGSLNQKYNYKYDNKGNKIEQIRLEQFGVVKRIITYKYEYDKNNNWIKRIIFLDKNQCLLLKKPLNIMSRI